jgi:hypothetical protein
MTSFAALESGLPPVWGPGEDIELSVRVLDADGNGIARAEILVGVTGAEPMTLATADDGACSVQWVAEETGAFSVMIQFEGDADHLPSSETEAFRIVDYREEIVRLYNAFLDWAQSSTGTNFEQSTPREVELLIVSGGSPVSQKSLDDLISRFEEADYSEHVIERRHYVSMYRAWRSVVEG